MPNNNTFKIFLLDDDPFCLAIGQKHLENMGHKDISCFTDGTSCIDSLIQQPDIIFLDYSLGTDSGIDVLKRIKQFSPDIYVIFISGQEDVETAVSALKHGAFDYIIKGQEETEKIKNALQKIHQIQNMIYNNKPGFLKRFLFML